MYHGKHADILIMDDFEIKAEWYDDPTDQLLVLMGSDPRPEAKYTIPKDILADDPLGTWITWDQRYG